MFDILSCLVFLQLVGISAALPFVMAEIIIFRVLVEPDSLWCKVVKAKYGEEVSSIPNPVSVGCVRHKSVWWKDLCSVGFHWGWRGIGLRKWYVKNWVVVGQFLFGKANGLGDLPLKNFFQDYFCYLLYNLEKFQHVVIGREPFGCGILSGGEDLLLGRRKF